MNWLKLSGFLDQPWSAEDEANYKRKRDESLGRQMGFTPPRTPQQAPPMVPPASPVNLGSLDDFSRAYITAALWASTDDNEEPLDKNYDVNDLAPETLQKMHEDCQKFQRIAAVDLSEAFQRNNYDDSSAGHDFWLTRNSHGAGFWDRDLGDVGDRLTKRAHAFGEWNLYVSDDIIYGG